METPLLVLAGLVAGFIDSIAGGGGLITLPTIASAIGPGVTAIGTNKIPGTVAALVALVIYARQGHFNWRRALVPSVLVWTGSLSGTFVSPLLPKESFHWILSATCPLILYLVWRRDLWVQRELEAKQTHGWKDALAEKSVAACFLAGFYDGAWGPGGGTLMFLALFFVARLPLLEAVAGSKLMNTGSAFVSLLSYSARGYVDGLTGITIASGIVVGAMVGANLANRNAAKLVRPVLTVVVLLLLLKFWR